MNMNMKIGLYYYVDALSGEIAECANIHIRMAGKLTWDDLTPTPSSLEGPTEWDHCKEQGIGYGQEFTIHAQSPLTTSV